MIKYQNLYSLNQYLANKPIVFVTRPNSVIKTYIYVNLITLYVTKLVTEAFYIESVKCMLMMSTAL